MKVEFEISDSDANTLIQSLQFVLSQPIDPATYNIIQGVIRSIQEDADFQDVFHQGLIKYLTRYTNGDPMTKKKKLKTDLSVSQDFINSPQGLTYLLNYILKEVAVYNKPGKVIKWVALDDVVKAETIQDCIDLIQDRYEAI